MQYRPLHLHRASVASLVVLTLALTVGVSVPAHARKQGDYLLQGCRALINEQQSGLDGALAFYCQGLIKGISHGTHFYERRHTIQGPPQERICVPNEVGVVQQARIVVRHLEGNLDTLHYVDTALVFRALMEAFPCSGR